MVGDRIDEATGKLAKIGAVQVVPGLSVLMEVASVFLLPNADARLKAAVEADLHDTVAQLQAKVAKLAADLAAQGKKLDDLGALRTIGLARQVGEATTQAESVEKREAVLNAAARQFDPRLGTTATRAYWFAKVRALSDVEVIVLRLLATEDTLTHNGQKIEGFRGNPNGSGQTIDRPDDEQAAMINTLVQLAGEPTAASYVQASSYQGGQKYRLTLNGRTIARYLAEALA